MTVTSRSQSTRLKRHFDYKSAIRPVRRGACFLFDMTPRYLFSTNGVSRTGFYKHTFYLSLSLSYTHTHTHTHQFQATHQRCSAGLAKQFSAKDGVAEMNTANCRRRLNVINRNWGSFTPRKSLRKRDSTSYQTERCHKTNHSNRNGLSQ